MKNSPNPEAPKYPHQTRNTTKQRVLRAQSVYESLRSTVNPSTNRKHTHEEAILKGSNELGVTPRHFLYFYLKDYRGYASEPKKNAKKTEPK